VRGALADRFWSKVRKTDSCWIWTASLSTHGYGQIGVNGGIQRAHRVAWMLTFGAYPVGALLHRCDNRSCCNPAHLFLGTQADNLRDMRMKGRGSTPPLHLGERNVNAKLTPDRVREIRQRHSAGESAYQLARVFGVWRHTIDSIVHRRTWTHL
jgi:hypothetical protein